MSDDVIKISGLREVQRSLYQYSQQLGDRVVLKSLTQGAQVTRKAIQAQIGNDFRVITGALKKGFVVRRSKIYRGRMSTDLIGVYVTLKKGKTAPFYGRFLNDGWQAGKTKVAGKHFVQAAFNVSKDAALRLIVEDATAGAALLAKKVNL